MVCFRFVVFIVVSPFSGRGGILRGCLTRCDHGTKQREPEREVPPSDAVVFGFHGNVSVVDCSCVLANRQMVLTTVAIGRIFAEPPSVPNRARTSAQIITCEIMTVSFPRFRLRCSPAGRFFR